jgi:hypothetical protein
MLREAQHGQFHDSGSTAADSDVRTAARPVTAAAESPPTYATSRVTDEAMLTSSFMRAIAHPLITEEALLASRRLRVASHSPTTEGGFTGIFLFARRHAPARHRSREVAAQPANRKAAFGLLGSPRVRRSCAAQLLTSWVLFFRSWYLSPATRGLRSL